MSGFSARLHWDLKPGLVAQAIARRRGSLLDLTLSNPTAAGFRYDSNLLMTLTDPGTLRYTADPLGLPVARQAVASYYSGAISEEHIVLTASTSEAYSWLFKLLCNPGDEILVPRPSYPLFDFLAELEGVRVVQYPMHFHEGWYIDADALKAAVTERTRAIIFVHPNNPTGSCLSRDEYRLLSGLCERHSLALIVDEVFLDYSFGPPVRTLATEVDVLTFVMSGLSKVAALPQMKLGWIVTAGPEPLRSAAVRHLELIADTFLSVGSPIQHALGRILEGRRAIQDQIRERTARNLAALRASGMRLLSPEAGWSAVLRVDRWRTEEEWILHLMEQADVLVHPGYFYDFESEAFLILSLLPEADTFAEGVRRIILAATGQPD